MVALADVPPERKPERGYIRMFPRNGKTERGYVRMLPRNEKPERGHIRQNHPFTKPSFSLVLTVCDKKELVRQAKQTWAFPLTSRSGFPLERIPQANVSTK